MRQRIPICLAAVASAIVLLFLSSNAAAQGNSVSGSVFGVDRRPVGDVFVELRDEFSRSLQRMRTNSAGRFAFTGLGSGRFKVAVLPYELPYQEEEHEVEIVNFSRSVGGSSIPGGFSNEIVDIYLRPKKVTQLGDTGVVFAQEIPPAAKTLYDKAIADLTASRDQIAYEELKQALEIFPKYYLALNRLGTEYVKQKHFEAAAILLGIAVDVNPRSYSGWYGLAYSRYSLNDLKGAESPAGKAVEVNPSSVEALVLHGSILRQLGKSKDAEADLLKANNVSKGVSTQVHWELALLYGNEMKRYADAARELKEFLKLQPDSKDSEKINKLIADFEAKAHRG
jgi:tetratricopeptide (TPR) repeat protein